MRLARGWNLQQAAAAAGMSYGGYKKIEVGERRLSDVHLVALSRAFGVPPHALLESVDEVPLLGFSDPERDDTVTLNPAPARAPAPIGATEATAAVEIKGGVFRGIATDGWLLYFEHHRAPVDETGLGELSLVETQDGKLYIRTPRAGSAPGLYHLESPNKATIYDARVTWAAIVTSIIPGRIAQRMLAGETFKTQAAPFHKPDKPSK